MNCGLIRKKKQVSFRFQYQNQELGIKNGYYYILYFTAEAPMSNKRPPPILAKKSCVGLIALELAPTVNYWFKR